MIFSQHGSKMVQFFKGQGRSKFFTSSSIVRYDSIDYVISIRHRDNDD